MDWDVIGNEWVVEILARHIAENQVRHAYLIAGPDGIGKTTLALRLAQALNCENPPSPGQYCGECRSCQLMREGAHPDLHLLESEEKGLALKVESVRMLQRKLALAPYEGRWRIAVLLRFHEATISAANAMLKTLEEPPERVVIIMTAREVEALPPTVVSRCELIPLRAVARDALMNSLIERGIKESRARLLSSIAAGRPGVAIKYAESEDLLRVREESLNDMVEILSMNKSARIGYVEKVTAKTSWETSKTRALNLLEQWQALWRDVLLTTVRSEVQIGNPDREEVIGVLAGKLTNAQVTSIIATIQSGMDAINQNANIRLTLESILLKIPRVRL